MTFWVSYKKTNCICDALRDLVAFEQFKKHEKHPYRSANFSKVPGFSETPDLNLI